MVANPLNADQDDFRVRLKIGEANQKLGAMLSRPPRDDIARAKPPRKHVPNSDVGFGFALADKQPVAPRLNRRVKRTLGKTRRSRWPRTLPLMISESNSR